jgi:SAM-dependent methyltransferase
MSSIKPWSVRRPASDLPPSEEEVIWCYRNLLGREPESKKVVKAHMKAKSLRVLVEEFLGSPEYQALLTAKARIPKANLLGLRPMHIDTQASADQLRKASTIIQQGWKSLGEEKPHFSVLTNERFLPENLDKSIGNFWQSGEAEADAVSRTLARFGIDDLKNRKCAEYGCGVGRTTMGLARHFGSVTAFDISSEHMRHARERSEELGRDNIDWFLVSDVLELPARKFDFFYSQIVFQHNPPPIIHLLIDWALTSLEAGGIAIFQVPTYSAGYSFDLDKWLNMKDHSEMQMHCMPQAKIFDLVIKHGCRVLEVREDDRTGPTDRFISNTFAIARPDVGS